MQFLEFIEAISRVADRVVTNLVADGGPIALGNQNVGLEQIEEEEELDRNEDETNQTNDDRSTKGRNHSSSSSEADGGTRRSNLSDAANNDNEDEKTRKEREEDKKAGLGLLAQLTKARLTLVNGATNVEMSETMTTSQKSPRGGNKPKKRRKRDLKGS